MVVDKNDKAAIADALASDKSNTSTFLHAAAYADFQAPLTGLTQVVDSALHTNLLPSVQFIAPPEKLQQGDSGYWAQNLGTTAGSVLPFVLAAATVKSFSRFSALETAAAQDSLMGLTGREAFVTGALHDSLLRPTDPNDTRPFLLARTLNGLAGGTSLLTMVKFGEFANKGAEVALNPAMFKLARIPIGMAAAAPAGALGAQWNALLSENRLASKDEMVQAAISNAAMAGIFSGTNQYSKAAEVDAVKSFKVSGGSSAINRGLEQISSTGEATFTAREDLGRQGLTGLFGLHNYGEARTLTVRNSEIAPPLLPQRAGSLDLLATCFPDTASAEHSIFGIKQEAQPLWMKAEGGRLKFALDESTPGDWQHLGPSVSADALMESIRKGNQAALRQTIDLLERVKYKQDLLPKEVPTAEGLLKVSEKTFSSGISPTGEKLLSNLTEQEQNVSRRTLDAMTSFRQGAGKGVLDVSANEIKFWETLNGALDFRVSTIGERRAMSSSELDLVNGINKEARARIYELEQVKASGKPMSENQTKLLDDLKDAQDMVFDTVANRQLLDIADIQDSGRPLSFSEALRRRSALRLADEGINHYDKLAEIRGKDGLTDLEQKSLSELAEARNGAKERDQATNDAIRANNGHRAQEILTARERLKNFQQQAWRRQDPLRFENDMANVNNSQARLNELARTSPRDQQGLQIAAKDLEKAKQDMASRQLPSDSYRGQVQDLKLIQNRISELSKISNPTETQKTELTDLRGVAGQTVEAIFRDYIPWSPEAMDKTQSQRVPANLRKLGLKDGNNDEQALAVAVGNALEKGELNLKGNRPYQTPDYLDAKNWAGIHVPDGSAADHAKADYILFNRKTGHYFLFDITSSVDNGVGNILTRDMVARGTETVLADRKAFIAPEREPFILATSKDADWTSPQSAAKGQAALNRILSDVISNDQPFNIIHDVPPSTNPELPARTMMTQLENFQRSLSRVGYGQWSRELHGAINYLRGRQ